MGIKIGFTGTREEEYLTKERFIKLAYAFKRLNEQYGDIEFHHGCCEGADLMAAFLFRESFPTYKIIEHPPTDMKYAKLAEGDSNVEKRFAKPYLERNKEIVNASDVMIAWPKDMETEELRSGTWATVRYAKKKDKVVIFV